MTTVESPASPKADAHRGFGIPFLRERSQGDPRVSVAILDGPADLSHPCLAGAQLETLSTLVSADVAESPAMSMHGTHVTSVVFGQPGTEVDGLAPRCRGLLAPVFSDRSVLSQIDLSRAIQQAVDAGAHVINISGGQQGDEAGADDLLSRAIASCHANNVLVVAAAGNDSCACLHVPAALPTVLAVGAMDASGVPLDLSNWGESYQANGILAPGFEIEGAVPGGGTQRVSGTSFATAVVSGVVALMLSLQLEHGQTPDPIAVRDALIRSARPCPLPADDAPRCLAGQIDVRAAFELLFPPSKPPVDVSMAPPNMSTSTPAVDPSCACGPFEGPQPAEAEGALMPSAPAPSAAAPSTVAPSAVAPSAAAVQPSGGGSGLVYALGQLGYDFGTEARRDSFKQLMPAAVIDGVTLPANPYDARQMSDYLGDNPSEGRSLIWTLNLELTPIYALEPVGPFAQDIFGTIHHLLEGQIQAEDSEGYIERVSIPGRVTNRTVRLYSGQILPVIEIGNVRGIYGWNVNALRAAAVSAVKAANDQAVEEAAQRSLSSFLNRVYYELRNLGRSSEERAMNFAATNAFQVATAFSDAVGLGMELDSIEVQRSPFCRMNSDCWDVVLAFFDAENVLRARKLFRFTIDVSDTIPVTMGEVRSWSAR